MIDDYSKWEIVVAWLKKQANFLSDPRTIATFTSVAASVFMLLKLAGWLDAELDPEQISLLFQSAAGVVMAVAGFVTALAAIVIPVVVFVRSWTERPSRGLKPWLPSRG